MILFLQERFREFKRHSKKIQINNTLAENNEKLIIIFRYGRT